jgi:hypothetical protein
MSSAKAGRWVLEAKFCSKRARVISCKFHEIINPRRRRERAELPVLGINDQIEPAARHCEPAILLEPVKRLVASCRRGAQRSLGLRACERMPAAAKQPLDVVPGPKLYSFTHPIVHR